VISGSNQGMNENMSNPRRGRRIRGGFRVIPRENDIGEEVYVLVGPTGVALYTFTDVSDATREAAELNGARRHLALSR
jgi:hypothetical protein